MAKKIILLVRTILLFAILLCAIAYTKGYERKLIVQDWYIVLIIGTTMSFLFDVWRYKLILLMGYIFCVGIITGMYCHPAVFHTGTFEIFPIVSYAFVFYLAAKLAKAFIGIPFKAAFSKSKKTLVSSN